ncbi:MAG: helix-turn-helix domain-containing protein [Bacteroidetes bacterium]|nr:helix-turn-helix domain-containing protein [Bacteroidota bacterium]MCA6444072.1 helix-turn-helix domain-containing protein [Bacteroidota bacterium]
MSSNIKIQRICQYCGNEFTARTTVTQYCSDTCSKRAYKARLKAAKIESSNKETQRIKSQPIEELKAKEFLTVREVARLLNCSVRSAYYYIESGTIKAVNLGRRITRVKRAEIDKLFEQPQTVAPQPEKQPQQKQFDIADCYNLTEVQNKYGISETALQNLIKRNSIPKIKKGWFVYVPKTVIDKLLS